MTGVEIAMAMSEGNPGALSVVLDLLTKGSDIDRDAFAPIASVLSLDTLGIYGPRIWVLYADVCQHDLVRTMALLRAVQFGVLDRADLVSAIDAEDAGQKHRLPINYLLDQVCERLPNFGQPRTTATPTPEAP